MTLSEAQPTVLFLCVHNAGRSQMAAAFMERAGRGQITVHSAGSAPGENLNPAVVEALREVGIDISSNTPMKITNEMAEAADVIVTMGCGDACPFYPGKRYLDWSLEDPAGRPLEEVRTIRDQIARRVDELATELLSPHRGRRPHANPPPDGPRDDDDPDGSLDR
jgi:protein-tyrosine-phosphatase